MDMSLHCRQSHALLSLFFRFSEVFSCFFRKSMLPGVTFLLLATNFGCRPNPPPPPEDIAALGIPIESFSPAQMPPLMLEPSAKLDKRLVPECSGFAASRQYPGLFWTLSDSGNPATLVAIRTDGSVVKPQRAGADYVGVKITGVKNTDWEAVTSDEKGRILIADMGNNDSSRKNLRLLVFPEPNPMRDTSAIPQIIPVRYRDQTDFTKQGHRHYDCESIFTWRGSIYVFTKRWSDTWTVLYRLQINSGGKEGVFVPVASFNARGLVTDAAISPDGCRLVVLTYHNLWLFKLPAKNSDNNSTSSNPISGTAYYYPIQFPMDKWQAEAISFIDNQRVLIGSEDGALFTLDLSKIPEAAR
jgi:hypothetical protein